MKTKTQCLSIRIAPDHHVLLPSFIIHKVKYAPFYLALLFLCFQTQAQKGKNSKEVTLFTCAEDIGNGLYKASFGYTNPTNKTITVTPAESVIFLSDKIEESEFGGIQKIQGPLTFDPGTHDDVISVVFADNGHAKWTVSFGGSYDSKIRATLDSPVCEGDPFIVPVIGPGNGKTPGFVSPELISLAAGTAGDDPSSIIYQISPQEKVLIQITPIFSKTQEVIDMLSNVFGLQYSTQPALSDFIVDPALIISEGLSAVDVFFPIDKILPPPPPEPAAPALTDYFDIIRSAQALYTPFTSGIDEGTGEAVTQGDAAQKTDEVRKSFRLVTPEESVPVDGKGIEIVVFSNSFDANPPQPGQPTNEAIDVGNGDLPGIAGNGNPNGYDKPVRVIKEYPYTFGQLSDEGRAMLQIAHDIAPGADLAFRTGVLSPRDFELGVRDFIGTENKVLVDDITFPGEKGFGLTNIGRAIQNVVDTGNFYLTSSGNFSDAAYQAVFQAAQNANLPAFLPDAGTVAHAFDGVDDIYQRFSVKAGESYFIVLQYADEFASQDNQTGAIFDLDFWVVDHQERLLAANNLYNEAKDALEYVTFKALADGEANFLITSASGNPGPLPFRYIIYVKNTLEVLEYFDGAPTISGHAMTPEALAIGAVDFRKADNPEAQPFSTFSGTLPDGSAPSVALSSYDGVNTNVLTIGQNEVGGIPVDGDPFKNFFGTSASVVHVASAFALMKSALPSWYGPQNPVDILQLFKDNALKVGNEAQLGDGVMDALAAFRNIASQTGFISGFDIEFTSPDGSVVSADEFELTINGNYFPEDPTVLFGEDELPITFYDPENPTEIKVLVGPFTGNDPVTVFTNSTTPLGGDGGKSNPIFLLDPGTIAINITANDIQIEYGQDYDFEFTVEGLPEGTDFEGLGLPPVKFTTAATPPFPRVGNYVIFPSFDLENATPEQLAALEGYVVNFKNGSFIVSKKDLEIVPDPVEVVYGEPIILNLNYNYDTTGISDNEAFLSILSQAHESTFFPDNTLALVNRFNAVVNTETFLNLLDGGSWMATENTLNNRFVAVVNEMDLVDLDVADLENYIENRFVAVVNRFNAVVNGEDLLTGQVTFENRFVAVVNEGDLGGADDGNDYSEVFAILSADDDSETGGSVSTFYSLNLITGLDVTPAPEVHYSYPGALFAPIGSNFNITYNKSSITVNPAELRVEIQDLIIDQGTVIDPGLISASIEGYVFEENLEDVFPDGIPFVLSDASGNAYVPGATGVFFITISDPKNYFINHIRTGTLYINPTDTNLRKIRTYLDCVEENFSDPDGLYYIANFRYENPNDQTIYIPVGEENKLTGPALNSGGLPFIFLPGTGTFKIRFDGNTLKWELTSRESTHKSSTTSEVNANSNRCDLGGENSSAFVLYPNPVNGILSIDQNLPEVVTLQVFDMFGISQLSRTLDGRSGPVTHQVDMSSYLNGLYFFRFTAKDGVFVYSVIKE